MLWYGLILFWFIFFIIFYFALWSLNLVGEFSLLVPKKKMNFNLWLFFFFCFSLLLFLTILFNTFLTTTDILILSSINLTISDYSFITEINFPFLLIFFFITGLASFYTFHYNKQEFIAFQFYLGSIFVGGFFFFSAQSFLLLFFSYEMFLIPSFLILYNFAKTRRAIEAAYLMFFWTQFGALFLIWSFFYIFLILETTSFTSLTSYPLSSFEVNFLAFCWLIGFGVKLPLWPFYGWLPKAHVEASTNFSIFLSGVLVKFAFFGLLKSLLLLQHDVTFPLLIPFLFIGLTDASFKLFIQIDLKKIVAYATVIEMHWLAIAIFSGLSPLFLAGLLMLVNHALLSTIAFFLVDAINRRFKTRLITELTGLNLLCPKLFLLSLINVLLFLGFPGSLSFVTEFLFFSFFIDLFPLFAPIMILFLYVFVPTFFFRSWFNAMFGTPSVHSASLPVDLTNREAITFFTLELMTYSLGFSWQLFL
uniref:NADH dehydrogenase subunit 4 n=1 Tax=Bakuella subtropica TaxID=1295181 RepID=UPI0023F197AC|nr:NADH dehydrogenase subunit 4 [Bakuella subtropica]WDY80884.1 NADH dehydrogenase subunit 4 [Bakuella subtropica]